MILAGLGFLLWAAARFVEAKAKANPKHDRWDDAAPKLVWASKLYSEAIDWLADAGYIKWSGQEKLKKLNEFVAKFEKQVAAGNYLQAVSELIGFCQDAKNKAIKKGVYVPFSPSITQSRQVDTSKVGPDTVAKE